jgi:hypothetical protein
VGESSSGRSCGKTWGSGPAPGPTSKRLRSGVPGAVLGEEDADAVDADAAAKVKGQGPRG